MPSLRDSGASSHGVLRGTAADRVVPMRLETDLRHSRFVRDHVADARLLDPRLERAFEEVAEETRVAARAEGFAEGCAEGRAAGLAEARAAAEHEAQARAAADAQHCAEVRRAVEGLRHAAAELERRAVVPAEALRDAAVLAALDIAAAVLGREVDVSPSPGLDGLRRALDLVPRNRPVVARLNPADCAALAALGDDALADETPGREVTLVADATVERGGCIAESDATRVDSQIGAALARVRQVLAP